MEFTPQSDAEVAADQAKFKPFPSGDYDYEIIEATDDISKAGNSMIKLRVAIYNANGEKRTVFDYIMASVMYKLKHCAESCGLHEEYESGRLEASDFINKAGMCKVRYVPEDKKAGYPEKNDIRDYIPATRSSEVKSTKLHAAPRIFDEVDNDPIPF